MTSGEQCHGGCVSKNSEGHQGSRGQTLEEPEGTGKIRRGVLGIKKGQGTAGSNLPEKAKR